MDRQLFSRFTDGIDRRYSESDSNLQSFHALDNCFISNTNRIHKRNGFSSVVQLDYKTEGLFPFDGSLWVFQASENSAGYVQPNQGPDIWTIILNHSGIITRVHYVGVLLGGLYCSIEFNEFVDGNPVILHYYLLTNSDKWEANREFINDPQGTRIVPVESIDDVNKTMTLEYFYEADVLRNPRTGTSEPAWQPVADTIDNNFKWKPVTLLNRNQTAGVQSIQYNPDGVYIIPEYRKSDASKTWRAWKAININEGDVLETGADGITSANAWDTTVGSTTIDGEIIWEAIQCSNWAANQGHWDVDFPMNEEDIELNQYAHTLTSDQTEYGTIYRGEWDKVVSGPNKPDWPIVDGGKVQDGDITWIAKNTQIKDENCPNTAEVLVLKSKVYAIGSNIKRRTESDIVRYSATNNPFDWSSADDAGFLPTGAQSSGSEIARALGRYDSRLVVIMDDNIELWTVDEDPQLNALFQTIGNLGTTFSNTALPISTDMIFLSSSGFKSLGARLSTTNFEDTNIGDPINDLVIEAVSKLAGNPVASLYTTDSQYWCVVGDKIFVWTWSRNSKVQAWSVFTAPELMKYFSQLNEKMYIRTENDQILTYDTNKKTDYSGNYSMLAEFKFQSLKSIGILKQGHGFDMLITGEAQVSFGYDARNRLLETQPITINGNTRAGGMLPLEAMFTEISPRIRYTGPDDLRVDAVSIYSTQLGLM